MMLPFNSWWTRGLLLLVGIVLLVVSAGEFYGNWRFDREARATRGTIVKKEIRTSRSRRGGSLTRSRTRHYDVTYRFTIADHTFEGDGELSKATWDQLNEGGPVDLLYLPDTPSTNRLALSTPWVTDALLGLIGIVFTSAGIISAFRAGRRARSPTRTIISVAVVLSLSTSAAGQTPRAFGFRIDLDTSGGFTGQGQGGITIEGDGTVLAARRGNRTESSCAGKLTAEEIASISDAVASAQRNPWPTTFDPPNDNGCCDRFRYTLRLWLPDPDPTKPGRTFTAMWHSASDDRLPKDIDTISHIALATLKRELDRCSRSAVPR